MDRRYTLSFETARIQIHAIINIIGLAVGIACCVVIMLYVQNELSYDTVYENADCIYRVYVKPSINGQQSSNCKTAAPLGKTRVRDFPEVITCTRVGFFGNHVLKYADRVYRERRIYTADSNFFSVFSLPLIAGNPRTVLIHPNSIVMTRSTAHKYFGKENPVGKIVRADSGTSYVVAGVVKGFPANSSFRCDILLSMSTYPVTENNSWLDMSYTTYVVLKRGTDPVEFQAKMKRIVDEEVGPQAESALGTSFREILNNGNTWGLYLQPLTSIYLYSQRDYEIDPNSEWGDQSRSDIGYVYIFTAIAVIILLLAIINFINLTTARSESRLKEVGIKKTLGSNRMKLIGQFFTESILVALLSILISIALIESFLPFFNQLAGKNLRLEIFGNAYAIPGLILDVDYDLLQTFAIPLLRGRFFSKEFPSDTASVVINEAMARECRTEDPVGKELLDIGRRPRSYRIIGVVKDFHYQSLHEHIKPLVLFLSPVTQAASIVTIRIAPGDVQGTTAFIDHIWKKVTGGEDIFASFVRQDLERLYKSDERAGTVAALFSGLAIFIACFGLFGLASFVTEQRMKEIGIRKVLGASVAEIVALLSKEFVKWVLVANVVAWPAGYYIMNNWLKSVAYRTDMSPWVFVVSGILALAVAILTVSSFTVKAATANPFDSLKCK